MAKRKAADDSGKTASFEDSLNELQSIVSELEAGSLGLEASLARFERGVGLLRSCYSLLESTEQKVEILTRFGSEGGPVTESLRTAATFDPAGLQATGDAGGTDGASDDVEDSGFERPSLF